MNNNGNGDFIVDVRKHDTKTCTLNCFSILPDLDYKMHDNNIFYQVNCLGFNCLGFVLVSHFLL